MRTSTYEIRNDVYQLEKNGTFSFQQSKISSNSNLQKEQETNQVTRQQLLLGLMGLEQQLKKLQEQSQQRHSQNCNSSTSSNHRCEDEENLSPLSHNQQPQFVSFCNIPNDMDATPTRQRSGRVEGNPFSQLQKQQSSTSTQVGLNSNCDILTPSKKVNIINGGGSTYNKGIYGSEQKVISSYHNNSMNNCYTQYNDINEFCLEDDDDNPKIETSTMSESKSRDFNKIKEVVYFIVNSLDKDVEGLAQSRRFISEDEHFADKKQAYLIIFDQLVKKFKHLKKTKEEKTKFCMRKAFRYLFAQLKTSCNSKMNLKEANEICMKHYFSQHVNDSQFVLPFRRNSSIKTMNAAFLKKVFASTKFVQDYRDFLHYFDRLAFEDNSKKVDQLAYYILPMVEDNKFDKIDGLRRLPWTMNLLDSTRNLAYQLLDFEENPNVCSQSSQQTIPQNMHYTQNESLRESISIFNSPSLCATNNQSQNDENLSNVDTLSVQTQIRKISEPYINMELLSRKQSMSSNDSSQVSNSQELDSKQFGEQSDSHLNYLKQINNALLDFQQNWQIHQQLLQKQKSREIKREIIVLTPPLYDLNENPHKKFQFNFCK